MVRKQNIVSTEIKDKRSFTQELPVISKSRNIKKKKRKEIRNKSSSCFNMITTVYVFVITKMGISSIKFEF